VDYILYDDRGHEIHQHARRHSFQIGETCYKQQYSRVVPLLGHGEAFNGAVLGAQGWLLSAAAVWQKGAQKLAENPFYFVDVEPISEEQ